MRRGTCWKLSQNTSTIAAIMRLSAVGPGRFSSRLIVGCEHRSSPLSGKPPDRHLEGRVGAQRVAIIAVGIARRDQQGAEADHLGERMPHPLRRTRVFDTRRQSVGDSYPLLDRREQQYPSVRCHLAAVEGQVHRLSRDRWQTRQNPRTFVHGGRELRCLRLIRSEKPNHTRIQRLLPLPPPSSHSPVNYCG